MSSRLKIDTRVRSLKNYLEEFERGTFQIPSFQRDFLWTQDDIKQLFDSIKNNFPIGSILFWKPFENASSWIGDAMIGPYKILRQNNNEPIYILDGFQRLSSLFGCLTNPEKYDNTSLELNKKNWEDKFNIYYDLKEEQFTYIRQKNDTQPYQVPVYIFMNSVDFRKYSRSFFDKIEDESAIELYLDRADALGQIFTNYQIASVDINYAEIEEAVEIFWRVNAKGVLISKDWIVSALTLTNEFRLGTEIDNLLNDLKPFNFDKIKRDVIFQCIQSSFGKIYFDYKIEELVKRIDFVEITLNTIKNIKSAVKFLYEELLVLNSRLIPYNSQLIFLTTFFNRIGDSIPTDKQILSLKKWFWITSYSNYFTIYSLSDQRKAFEQFSQFVENENINPVYNDSSNIPFKTLEFPPRINMKSVRAKALTLFIINYVKGNKEIGLQKINAQQLHYYEIGNLFALPQKDNLSENCMPLIIDLNDKKNEDDKGYLSLDKLKDYSFILQLDTPTDNYFVNHEMKVIYKANDLRKKEILQMRKQLIMEAERAFVMRELNIDYYEDDFFGNGVYTIF